MLTSFFLSPLYQEPDPVWASSQVTFPGHSGLAKMTDSQRLRVLALGTDSRRVEGTPAWGLGCPLR